MKSRIARLPFGGGRLIWDRNRESIAETLGNAVFATNLRATKFDGDGKLVHEYDLGSGLVTNVGVLALAAEIGAVIPGPSGVPNNLFALLNQHGWGTGVTAAAATDIQLQTAAAPTTAAAQAGAQSTISAANLQKFQSVATITAGGVLAITEWGIFNGGTLSGVATGSPFTAATATSGTVTATPLTASSTTVRGQFGNVFLETTTTPQVWGLVTASTTSVVTVPAWYNATNGLVGTSPVSTNVLSIIPVMFDHKVFSAINVVSADSIQFTYQLTITSGG